MTIFLVAAIKTSVVLAAACLAAASLGRRSAALRHWVLALGILGGAAAPALDGRLPAWTVPSWMLPAAWSPQRMSPTPIAGEVLRLRSNAVDMTGAQRIAAPPSPGAGPSVDQVVFGVWAAGAALALSGLLAGAVRIRRLAARAERLESGSWAETARQVAAAHGVTRPVTLLQSTHPSFLVTWGLLRPRVLLPTQARQWSADRVRIVLHHELAHVRRGDWAVQLASALVTAIWWFNPLAWLADRRLRHESELACDDLVLRQGIAGADYAAHLLDVARTMCASRRRWVPAPAAAHPTMLEQRIRAMLNQNRNRQPLRPVTRAATTLALAAATLLVAAAAVSASSEPESGASTLASVGWSVDRAARPGSPVDNPAAAQQRRPGIIAGTGNQVVRTPPTGTLSGTVLDQLGGLLPGADVSLVSAAGGTRTAVTDGAGAFEFKDIPAGTYTLQLEQAGFETMRLSVSVPANAVHERRIALPIGTLQETISVTGSQQAPQGSAPERAPVAVVPPTPLPPYVRDADAALREIAARTERAGAMQLGGVRVGGNIRPPVKIVHVNPVYRAASQRLGIEGVVELIARVGVDGYVIEALQPRSADAADPVHPDLVVSAIDAVRQWRFTPTLLNDIPVEVNLAVSVQFSLR